MALIGEAACYRWDELDRRVDAVAGAFQELGISKGDIVGLCISKRPEIVITFLAAARVGALVAPINYKMERAHLCKLFQECCFSLVVLERRFESVVAQAHGEQPPRYVYVGDTGSLSTLDFESLSGDFNPDIARVAPQDPVYLNVTSGTTGRPKSAVGTHAQVLWNALATVEALDFRTDDVFLCMFSAFSHPHEIFHRSLITGASTVVIDTLSPRRVAKLIRTHRVTWVMAVPAFYEMLLTRVGPEELDCSSLRVLESGGTWVSPDTLRRIEASFECTFIPVWGSTETHGVALALLAKGDRPPGATGWAIPHYTVEVVNRHGRPVPVGEVGEMVVSGPAVATGYYRQEVTTKAHFRDGRYFTGDLVRRDEGGLIWFIGRKNDLMKVGGIRVFPLEIEKAVVEHPSIAEVSVVRAMERVRGEIPRAIVCLHSGESLSPSEVKAWCRKHLAVYKIPRIVEFWPNLPRLPNGKIDRRVIEQTPIGKVA
jgi:acyl-coenzyme A synthetase/AMP-(fatty) acid ligase